MLQPAKDVQGLHLQAQAASLLGDYRRARLLWESLAVRGDREALAQLARLEQRMAPGANANAVSGPRYPR